MAVRLFCLPHAGGSALAYRNWGALLPSADIEVHPLELPGRGSRLGEPTPSELNLLVAGLAEAIRPELPGPPYALFGHSMGALLAFELARYLRRTRAPLPSYILVAARRAPNLRPRDNPLSQVDDAGLLEWMRATGGTPRAVLDEPMLIGRMLPLLRADLRLVEDYTYAPELPLACPIGAFGGMQDQRTSAHELECWRMHTSAEFSLRFFPGGHFFVHTAAAELLDVVASMLAGAA